MTYEQRVRAQWREITQTLIEKNISVTTMESCTSGLLASLISDTEGASAVMKGAFVTYSNEAKIMQGVPAETIEQYSVYSAETARAMAEACAKPTAPISASALRAPWATSTPPMLLPP